MGAVAIGAMVVGTALQVYGQQQQAEQQAEAANREAASREVQANEIMKRVKVNQQILQEQGDQLIGDQTVAYASAGNAIGYGSPLLALEHTATSVKREINNAEIEASFRANQLRLSGQYESQLAGQIKRSADIGSASTVLTAAYGIYSNSNKNSPSDSPSPGPLSRNGMVTESGGVTGINTGTTTWDYNWNKYNDSNGSAYRDMNRTA